VKPARLLVAVALLGAACAPAAAARPVSTTTVDLPPSYIFQPAAIEVTRGSTVTWTNHDNFTHSVQVQGQSDVHMMTPGQSTQITFDQPGTYAYVCTLHTQNMKGTVVVD
jgi:plastocyanin